MKCDHCREEDARYHVHQVIGTERYDYHICAACAEVLGLSEGTEESLLAAPRKAKHLEIDECPQCGTARETFATDGRAGCPACYVAFGDVLSEVLDEDVSNPTHRGKLPRSLVESKEIVETRQRLKEELEIAVRDEKYETAAALRDQLDALVDVEEHND